MSDMIDTAIAFFERRGRQLEDEILRRQMALEEVRGFLAYARDGRSKLRRDAKRNGNSQEPAPELPGTEASAP